ncbi:group I truncated hemoglobin [Scytonema sp. NUACC21]
MSTLFEKLGGQQGVEQIVDEFYKRVMGDATLNHFFAHTDMQKQYRHQAALFSQLFDGPKQYTGREMAVTHTGMNLQQKHFDAIEKHLRESLAVRGVSADDVNAAVARVATLKDAILNK